MKVGKGSSINPGYNEHQTLKKKERKKERKKEGHHVLKRGPQPNERVSPYFIVNMSIKKLSYTN